MTPSNWQTKTHWLVLFGLCLVALGLPLSAFLMSVGQMFIAAAWLLQGHYIERLKSLFKQPIALFLIAVYLMHVVGIAFTQDMPTGWRELRIKAPLFLFPFLLASMGQSHRDWLTPNQYKFITNAFVFAVFCGTAVSMGVLYHIVPTKHKIHDTRDISIYVSHIRFSLMLVLAIILLPIYNFKSPASANFQYFKTRSVHWHNLFVALLMLWFLVFLIILHALTGVVILVLIAILYGLKILLQSGHSLRKNAVLSLAGLAAASIAALALANYINGLMHETFQPVHHIAIDAKATTAQGNHYQNDTSSSLAYTENGYLLGAYVCWPELKASWNLRSRIAFDSLNANGDSTKFTLCRYLTSKGLRKDAAAVQSLSAEEIKAIEEGCTNCNYLHRAGITVRLLQTLWEFKQFKYGETANGHSLTMRFEFWKAAWGIIQQHFWWGVGTGDFHQAMQQQYQVNKTQLSPSNRLDPHNQFLSIWVSFGLTGLLLFLTSLFLPLFGMKGSTQQIAADALVKTDVSYLLFALIILFSFFTEDTLSTQAGVTFYAFFNALMLFAKPHTLAQA